MSENIVKPSDKWGTSKQDSSGMKNNDSQNDQDTFQDDKYPPDLKSSSESPDSAKSSVKKDIDAERHPEEQNVFVDKDFIKNTKVSNAPDAPAEITQT